MFKALDKIDAVKAEVIQRVAKTLFLKSNRTVGLIETTPDQAN